MDIQQCASFSWEMLGELEENESRDTVQLYSEEVQEKKKTNGCQVVKSLKF